MTVYADLSTEHQDLLRASLAAAAVAVSAASPGRKEETASEGFAAASFVLGHRADHVANPLISSVIVELERRVKDGHAFPDYVELASAPGAYDRAIETLRSVSQLLGQHATPDEADGFRRWLLRIAQVTSEAGREDQGRFGLGGVVVNDAERAAMQAVADALGIMDERASGA